MTPFRATAINMHHCADTLRKLADAPHIDATERQRLLDNAAWYRQHAEINDEMADDSEEDENADHE